MKSTPRPLTAGQLARILAAEDPKKLVVIEGRDGAHFTIHSTSASLVYDPKTHETGLAELTVQATRLGYTEDDVLPKGKPAVILSA